MASERRADLNEVILRIELDGINPELIKFSNGSINYLGEIVKQTFSVLCVHNLSNNDIYFSTVIEANSSDIQGIKTVPANGMCKIYKDSIIQISLFSNSLSTVELCLYKG